MRPKGIINGKRRYRGIVAPVMGVDMIAQAARQQEGVKRGDNAGVAHLVPDEMASTFVVSGTPNEVRKKVEPVWEVADSVCLLPPVLTVTPEKSARYFRTIAETFYV